jgi:hypothetical protein
MKQGRVLDQHIAVFGESGSGKTVLVSSFYGAAQEPSYIKKSPFYIVATETGQGNRLHQNYLGMKNSSRWPEATRFEATSYSFAIKLKDASTSRAMKNSTFDALRMVWHDYPGEWFEQDQSSPEEARRRIDAFTTLMQSDVALLLVDGQRLLENPGEEEQYLKLLLTNFRNGLLSLWDGVAGNGKPVVQFPRIWVLALSKSDLLPDVDVFAFRDLLIEKASAELDELRQVISGLVLDGGALSVGEDFMLLSSAKFMPLRIEVTARVGVELILPIAAALPLKRHLKWAQGKKVGGVVAKHLLEGVEAIANALGGVAALIEAMDKKKDNKLIAGASLLLKTFGSALAELVNASKNRIDKANRSVVAEQETLKATFARFEKDLENGEDLRILIRGDK